MIPGAGEGAAWIGRVAAEYYPDSLPIAALWYPKARLGVVANALFSDAPAQVDA